VKEISSDDIDDALIYASRNQSLWNVRFADRLRQLGYKIIPKPDGRPPDGSIDAPWPAGYTDKSDILARHKQSDYPFPGVIAPISYKP
jgi:hypothetical protein